MTNKHLLIVETHSPYTGKAYKEIIEYALGSNYEIETRSRHFESHEGEKDIRNYTRFKMMVTPSEEEYIKNRIRTLNDPRYSAYGGGNA